MEVLSPKVIGYVRVSTVLQADEGVSLDAQRERIEGWAGSAGLPLDPAKVFVDAGISGKRADNRPALQAALDAACSGPSVLVVYSLSRLARSVRDTLAIAERLDRAGADLVSLSENLNTTSASGKMLFRLLAVLAEFERDLISERTKGALAHKRDQGEAVGHAPYGSKLDPADPRRSKGGRAVALVPCPEELEALAVMCELAAQGRPLKAIAAELDRRGFRPRRGQRWARSTVSDLLSRSREVAPS